MHIQFLMTQSDISSLHRQSHTVTPSSFSTYISWKKNSPSQALWYHALLTVSSSPSLQIREELIDGKWSHRACWPSRVPDTLMSITILCDSVKICSLQKVGLFSSLFTLYIEHCTQLQPYSLREILMTRRPRLLSDGFN